MLVCNETIAENMYWQNLPFVYRVHEEPDDEKLQRFKDFIHNLGYTIKSSQEIHPRALQEILEKVQGKPEETVVSTLLLRSMMQARYSPAADAASFWEQAAAAFCLLDTASLMPLPPPDTPEAPPRWYPA